MFYPFSPLPPPRFPFVFHEIRSVRRFLFRRKRKFVVDFFFVFVFIVAGALPVFGNCKLGKRGDSIRGMFFLFLAEISWINFGEGRSR